MFMGTGYNYMLPCKVCPSERGSTLKISFQCGVGEGGGVRELFRFKVDAFSKARQNRVDRVVSSERVLIPHNLVRIAHGERHLELFSHQKMNMYK